jgi:predicted CoA-binding protein
MRVLVYGASVNPDRYAYRATELLISKGHEVVLLGQKPGTIDGVGIELGQPDLAEIHTVTLYVGPKNQTDLFDYLIRISPKRVIFNPGTENQDLMKQLNAAGMLAEEACTLVLLHTDQF